MKIAFLLDQFPCLTQTFVLNQVIGVIEAGHRVDIYAMSRGSSNKIDRRVDEYGLAHITRYVLKAPAAYPARIADFSRLIFKRGWKYPVPVLRSLNCLRFGRKALSLKLFFKVFAFLQNRLRYDLIHCQFGMLALEALDLKKTGALKGRLVTSFRGYDTEKFLRKNPGAYDELFRCGDLFLPVCSGFARWLIESGCPPEKVKVLYSGIDPLLFQFKPRKLDPGQPVRVLSVARLVPKKGLAVAVEAVAALAEQGVDIIYTIVGDGYLKEEIKALVGSKGLHGRVRLAGWRNRDEVLELMRHSHILLAPSMTAEDGDREGIPNVIKEAMAMGMPVVGTVHSGIPELVVDGRTGYLAREADPADLCRCLARMINASGHWEEFGRAGRQIIEEHFDTRKLNRQLLELYAGLLEKQVSASKPVNCNKRAA